MTQSFRQCLWVFSEGGDVRKLQMVNNLSLFFKNIVASFFSSGDGDDRKPQGMAGVHSAQSVGGPDGRHA